MPRRMLVISAIVCCLAIGNGSWALDRKTSNARIEQLKNMSSIERDRFNRNAEMFRSMSPEQKNHYRELHEKLAADRRNGGTLGELMDTYSQWLSSLTPAQRDQLQAEKQPGKKQVLVRQLMEERERLQREAIEAQTKEGHDRNLANDEGTSSDPKNDTRPTIIPGLIRLERKELDAIMRVIAEDLPAEQRPKEIEKLTVFQYPAIIKQSIAARKNSDEWPDDEMLKKMEQSQSGKKISLFRELGRMGPHGREIAASVILRETLVKAYDSLYKPTDDERKMVYEKLKPFEKRRYDNLKTEKGQRDFLNQRFLEREGDASYGQFQECGNNILALFDELKIVPPEPLLVLLRRPNKRGRTKY